MSATHGKTGVIRQDAAVNGAGPHSRPEASVKSTGLHSRPEAAKSAPGHSRSAGARHEAARASDARALGGRPPANAKRVLDNEDELFSALLGSARDERQTPFPSPVVMTLGAGATDVAPTPADRTEPAMLLWRALEPELAASLAQPFAEGMAMTLLLPRLGAVDARFTPLTAGGWDIALRFNPAVWRMLAPHRERCRHALGRRLACRVRLSFARGEVDARRETDA